MAKGQRVVTEEGKVYYEYPEYHREWRRMRGWAARMQCIELLGGCCATCGYNDNLDALEMDHITPVRRKNRHGGSIFWCTPLDKLSDIVKGCQLLCANCHRIKTRVEARMTIGWHV